MVLRLSALITLAVMLASCHNAPPTKVGQLMPDFVLQDSGGKPVQLSAYRGRVVLLDFWATDCCGCITEIPWYVQFQSKYRDQGLMAIGVSMDDDGWKSVRPFIQAHAMNYPVVISSWQDAATRYGITMMPTTFLIDRNGRIAYSYVGVVVNKDTFESEIQSLLKQGAT